MLTCTDYQIRTDINSFGDYHATIALSRMCLIPICQRSILLSTPGEIRTHNPMIKSHVHLPVELRGYSFPPASEGLLMFSFSCLSFHFLIVCVVLLGSDPSPEDFQSSASTKLA